MLPPIDEKVLANNPGFENLYKSLTINVLDEDGSTKNDAGAEKRNAVREELRSYRLKATKQHLLKHAISTTTPPSSQPSSQAHRRTKSQLSRPAQSESGSQLPPDLIQLLLLLPPFLERASSTPTSSLELLLSSPPFNNLPELLPHLAPLLSSHLTSQASALTRVLHPATNPSFIPRAIPSLLPTTAALQTRLAHTRATLSTDRLATTTALQAHLSRHTDALVLLLRALEAKHGAASHSAGLRAADAALAARSWALALQHVLWEARAALYPPAARTALRGYRRHLESSRLRLGDAIRAREAELGEYGVAVGEGPAGGGGEKERRMREMGRVWREMEGRLGEVTRDLERLGRS